MIVRAAIPEELPCMFYFLNLCNFKTGQIQHIKQPYVLNNCLQR